MRRAALVAVAMLCLAAAPAASAKTTKNFTFTSSGKAVVFGAAAGTGAAGTYEDFPFTIAKDEADGAFSVGLLWDNPADDWDLYVYQRVGKTLQQVGSSAGGPPSTEEATTVQSQGIPLTPGQYVVRAQNYAATSPSFHGTVKFAPFTPPNKLPSAKLKVKRRVRAGQRVKLSARGSKDPDGRIVGYAWDLDGDGTMDATTGKHPTLRHRFRVGRHHVTVRVIDNKGAKAFATRTLLVYPKKRHGG